MYSCYHSAVRRFAKALLLATTALGCSGEINLAPPIEPSTQAVLFVVEHEGRPRSVHAIDPGEIFRTRIDEQGDLILTALLYNSPLEALGLQAGELELAEEGDPLPTPDLSLSGELSGETFTDWARDENLDPRLMRLRLAAPTPQACAMEGGCYAPRADGFLICMVPCEAPAPPTPPAPPAEPRMTPCPQGWSTIDDQGLTLCEPWPRDAAACPTGQARFVGAPSCARLLDCPLGLWPKPLPQGALHVSPTAGPGGNGTLGQPFATLQEALTQAADGDTIALSQGDHQAENVQVDRAVALVGACPEGTRLVGGVASAALTVTASGAEARDLSVLGARRSIRVGPGGLLRVQRLELSSALDTALTIEGTLIGERLSIRDPGRMGISAPEGGRAQVQALSISPLQSRGVETYGGHLTLSDCAIVSEQGAQGAGLWCDDGGSATLERCLIEGTQQGIIARGQGVVSLTDGVLRDLNGELGYGIEATADAEVSGDRVLIDRARYAGALVLDSVFALRDLVIQNTQPDSSQAAGIGVISRDQALMDLSRAHLRNNQTISVVVRDDGFATLRDVHIEETQGRAADGDFGTGLRIVEGGRVTAHRLRILRSRGLGVYVSLANSTLVAEDMEVSDTLPREANGGFGRGLEVDGSAAVDITRGRFLRNRNVSVFVLEQNSTAILTDLHIADTIEPDECPDFSCAIGTADGLNARQFSRVTVERFLLENNLQAGFQARDRANLQLKNGLIRGNLTGGIVGVEEIDLRALGEGVRYEDNFEALNVVTQEF